MPGPPTPTSEGGEKPTPRLCQVIWSSLPPCVRVLPHLTLEERKHLLRLVVECITVPEDLVRIETIIPMGDNNVILHTPRPCSLTEDTYNGHNPYNITLASLP